MCQRGAAVVAHDVWVRAQLEEDMRRGVVALERGPMQRRVSQAVRLVDRDLRSADDVDRPVLHRVHDGMQAVVSLRIEGAWVRAMLDEQVDGVHEAVAPGPM